MIAGQTSQITNWFSGRFSSSAKKGFISDLYKIASRHPRVRKVFGSFLERYWWYCLLVAQKQREAGDHHGAFKTLMLGQRRFINEPWIHLKLSEIYRDNCEIYAAYTHLKIADKLSPGHCTIRLATFETDHAMFTEGAVTMGRILNFPSELTDCYMTMINRISIYYPQYQQALAEKRISFKQDLITSSYKHRAAFSSAVRQALSNRWLNTALFLKKGSSLKLTGMTQTLFDRLVTDLGPYAEVLELAWKNEDSCGLYGYRAGKGEELDSQQCHPHLLVEIFIPTPFFTIPHQEKPTSATVRRMFGHVISSLLARPNITLVPRFQLNWKECFPKTSGARVISYHTASLRNPLHLHIQESPLAGRCSIDSAGFAGFSSISTDYTEIEKFVGKVSETALIENQKNMLETYVVKNVSKYTQNSLEEQILGNYVFFVMQIPTDVVSKIAYIPGDDLLQDVVNFYRGTDVKVVVKRHPFCSSKGIQELLEQLESNGDIVITKNSVHRVIENAKLVITVNSGVGVEALIQGKLVIVSGACDYSYSAVTVKNKKEVLQVLRTDAVVDLKRIQKFLYFYVHRFTLHSGDGDQVKKRLDEWLTV